MSPKKNITIISYCVAKDNQRSLCMCYLSAEIF